MKNKLHNKINNSNSNINLFNNFLIQQKYKK